MTKTTVSVSLLAIGDEILRGEIQDTNSAYLAELLLRHGITVKHISSCGDDIEAIVTELGRSLSDTPLVIVTGGLGPTTDDITRDAIAELAGVPLELHPPSLEKLRAMAVARGRPMHQINERQAHFPQGAQVLVNPVGTADSFVLPISHGGGEAFIVSLPGVPVEMRKIVDDSVLPFLQSAFSIKPRLWRRFKCFGVSEAFIGQSIESCSLPGNIRISYRPVFPEVWVRLSTEESTDEADLSADDFDQHVQKCISSIGNDFVFSTTGTETLSEVVGKLLKEKAMTIAAAESCSGGLVSDALVSTSGSSEYFVGACVTYSNKAKVDRLGVSESAIESHGAVSEEVAKQMALGARKHLGADIGVSVTGIAGPGGGSEEKPVGTVWIGVSHGDRTIAVRHFYPIERNRFRRMSAALALDLVRRELSGLSSVWSPK